MVNCVIDKNIFNKMEQFIIKDDLYISALGECDEYYSIENFACDNDIDLISLLDDAIKEAMESIDINSVVSKTDDYLKLCLVKNYIEEYDDEYDLNSSIVYAYIQVMFMVNVEDSIIKGLYNDILSDAKMVIEESLESQEIDILPILSGSKFVLPIEEVSLNTLEFNKGYLLALIHTKLEYENQYKVLNILKGYTDSECLALFEHIVKEGKIRPTKWFMY